MSVGSQPPRNRRANVTRVAIPGEMDDGVDLPEAPSRMRVRGDEVGRYVIIERLGVGGMGEVYSAFDPELDRKVAIKLLVDERRASPTTTGGAARLVREAQAMAKLVHPNVVTVHDVGTTDEQVFVAMEWVVGGDLRGWMDAGPHPWREVLRRFLGAARGLAAAHRVGLVHRDFKPENVLIGKDGVLKVADFGLARRAGELPPEARHATERAVTDAGVEELAVTPEVDRGEDEGRRTNVDERLTVTGSRMGTPGYMAPEQWLGEEVGPAADQFAFCVALYEALYGERPHRGESANAQMFQVTEERIAEAPRNTKVPSWLRRIVLRGLKSTPRDRWADMNNLIAALERAPVTRFRNLAIAGVALGGLAVAAAVASREPTTPPMCEGARDEISSEWSPEVANEVREAFDAVGVSYAAVTVGTVIDRLDAYGDAWVDARTSACRATRIEGVETDATLTRRMACLQSRKRQLRGVVDMLREADADVVRRAVAITETLSSVEACLDRALLEQEIPPPADPDAAVQAEELEAQFDAVNRLRVAGRYDEAVERAAKAFDATVALNYPPLTAYGRLTLGEALAEQEDTREAGESHLERAMAEALALGDDRLFARAASRLGSSRGQYAEGDEVDFLYQLGFSAVERVGSAQEIRASLAMNYGNALRRRGDLDHARVQYDRALADYKAVYGDEHLFVGDALFNMGATAFQAGKYDQARKETAAAREIWSKQMGSEHPRAVRALSSLAAFEYVEGNYAGAANYFEEQLALTERLHGPDSPEVADVLSNLGGVYRYLRQPGRAQETLERAVKLREAKFGPESLWVGQALANLAPIHLELGDPERALATIDRAFGILLAARGADHMEMTTAHLLRGEILMELEDLKRARLDFERARTITLANQGPESPSLPEIERYLAEVHLISGDPKIALGVLDPVLANEGKRMESDHGRALAYFTRARAHAALRNAEAALTDAKRAEKIYAGLDTPIDDEHEAVRAFIEKRE